jgi:hypothetical protein
MFSSISGAAVSEEALASCKEGFLFAATGESFFCKYASFIFDWERDERHMHFMPEKFDEATSPPWPQSQKKLLCLL